MTTEHAGFDYDAELQRYHQRLRTAIGVEHDDRVLDIGCGTGLTTREAAAVAVSGSALGLDISERMVTVARDLGRRQGLHNVHFEQGDAQSHPFPPERFTLGVSRFGTMFFTDPHAAFTNIARALRPGARMVQLVWQDSIHQEWDTVVRRALGDERTRPPATSGGDAFSLSDPATAERLLIAGGFTEIRVTDVREPVYYGPDTVAACQAALSLQTNKDLLARLDPVRSERALERLRDVLHARRTAEGVWFDSRAWIITARRR